MKQIISPQALSLFFPCSTVDDDGDENRLRVKTESFAVVVAVIVNRKETGFDTAIYYAANSIVAIHFKRM